MVAMPRHEGEEKEETEEKSEKKKEVRWEEKGGKENENIKAKEKEEGKARGQTSFPLSSNSCLWQEVPTRSLCHSKRDCNFSLKLGFAKR